MHAHIGKYEVKRLLGKGATGSVYLASDAFASREVAIKVMDAMPADPEEVLIEHNVDGETMAFQCPSGAEILLGIR